MPASWSLTTRTFAILSIRWNESRPSLYSSEGSSRSRNALRVMPALYDRAYISALNCRYRSSARGCWLSSAPTLGSMCRSSLSDLAQSPRPGRLEAAVHVGRVAGVHDADHRGADLGVVGAVADVA